MSSTERGGAIEAEMVLDRWRSTAIGALRREGSTTINQYWILLMLDRPDPVPLSAVVETLELNYTTVAEGVARMAADGTVAKAESEDDRRATMVALTPEGRALLGRLDHALVQVAKRALAPLSGQLRIQAMALLYSACVRLNKNRTVGHLARGDSAFLIICQQVASNFATICKQNLVTAQQGHLLLAAASSDEPISAKEARRLLAFDAPTLAHPGPFGVRRPRHPRDRRDEAREADHGDVPRPAVRLAHRRGHRGDAVSATAKSAERATLSRRRRPRFPAGGATALWPPALPRAAAQGALDRGVVEVRGPDLNLQRRGALGVPGRDRPARDLPSAELREPDRHRDVLCAERGQPPRGVRGPHDCPLSGSPSPSAASASRSFMR